MTNKGGGLLCKLDVRAWVQSILGNTRAPFVQNKIGLLQQFSIQSPALTAQEGKVANAENLAPQTTRLTMYRVEITLLKTSQIHIVSYAEG